MWKRDISPASERFTLINYRAHGIGGLSQGGFFSPPLPHHPNTRASRTLMQCGSFYCVSERLLGIWMTNHNCVNGVIGGTRISVARLSQTLLAKTAFSDFIRLGDTSPRETQRPRVYSRGKFSEQSCLCDRHYFRRKSGEKGRTGREVSGRVKKKNDAFESCRPFQRKTLFWICLRPESFNQCKSSLLRIPVELHRLPFMLIIVFPIPSFGSSDYDTHTLGLSKLFIQMNIQIIFVFKLQEVVGLFLMIIKPIRVDSKLGEFLGYLLDNYFSNDLKFRLLSEFPSSTSTITVNNCKWFHPKSNVSYDTSEHSSVCKSINRRKKRYINKYKNATKIRLNIFKKENYIKCFNKIKTELIVQKPCNFLRTNLIVYNLRIPYEHIKRLGIESKRLD